MPSSKTHDIVISDTNGCNNLGFMLIQDRKMLREYGIRDAETIQPRFLSMGELTEAESPPALKHIWTQDCWLGGLGGFESDDSGFLANAIKIDASIDGRIKLAANRGLPTVCGAAAETKATGYATVGGTEVWSFIGRDVYSWNYACTKWVKGTQPVNAAVIYRNGAQLGLNTFVPGWNSATDVPNRYLYKADADCNWTRIGACTPNTFKYFAKTRNVNGCEILVGGFESACCPHTIRTSTDPTNVANWSGQTAIGDKGSEITALIEGPNNQLYIAKTNGLWSFSRSGIVENLLPEFENRAHPCNFRGSHNWNGHIFLPLGDRGMFMLQDCELHDISFKLYAPVEHQLDGKVVAVHGLPTELYILLQDACCNLTYHLLMSEFTEFHGGVDHRWHHLEEIKATTGSVPAHSALFADGIPGPCCQIHRRMWYSIESTGSNLAPRFMPRKGDAEYNVSTGAATDGTCVALARTIPDDRGFANICKTWQKVDLAHENLGAGGRQFAIEFRIDGGCWATTLCLSGGCGNAVTTGATSTFCFPDATTGKELELRFKPTQTCPSASSSELTRFTVTSQLRPGPVETLPLNIYMADGQRNKMGARESSVSNKLAQLRTWNGQAAEVLVTDAEGTQRRMVFMPGEFKVTEVHNRKGRRSEWVVQTVLAEVE